MSTRWSIKKCIEHKAWWFFGLYLKLQCYQNKMKEQKFRHLSESKLYAGHHIFSQIRCQHGKQSNCFILESHSWMTIKNLFILYKLSIYNMISSKYKEVRYKCSVFWTSYHYHISHVNKQTKQNCVCTFQSPKSCFGLMRNHFRSYKNHVNIYVLWLSKSWLCYIDSIWKCFRGCQHTTQIPIISDNWLNFSEFHFKGQNIYGILF